MKLNSTIKSIWSIKYFPPYSQEYTTEFFVSALKITEEFLIDLYLTKITNPNKVTFCSNKALYTICLYYHELYNKGSLGYDVNGPNCVPKGVFVFEKINSIESRIPISL